MEWIGSFGIIVALVVYVILAMRSYTVLVTAPICALVIILFNGMDVVKSFLSAAVPTSYMSGVGKFIAGNMMLFLLSAILGKYMDDSGAAKSIANNIMKMLGKDDPMKVLIAITVVGAILTYGGVAMFVVMFAVIPLARPLFKELNISWHLFAAAYALGMTSFTMAMFPGTPGLQNAIPAQALGTSLTAAWQLGLIGTVIVIVNGYFYMKWALKKSIARGEVYDCQLPEAVVDDKKLPSLFLSLIPLIVLLGIIFIGSYAKVPNVIYIALVVSILVAAVIFNPYFKSQKVVLAGGAQSSLQPILFTAAGVGIGAVVASAPGFNAINQAILNMPGGPLVSAATLSGVLAGIIGSGSGALGIMTQFFIEPYIAAGVNVEVLHRVISISASTFGALPNSGAMFGMFAAMGLTHRTAYGHNFYIIIVGQTVALAVAIILGSMFW